MVGALGTLVRWAAPPSAAALLCCVLYLGANAAPARADDEAKTLVALHKSYAGWELGDGTFNSMQVLETLQHVGADGKAQDVGQYDERRRGIVYHGTYVGTGGLRRDYGFTGSIFWSSNENGFTVPRYDEGRTRELAADIFFNEATTSLAAAVRKHDVVAGVPVAVLRLSGPNGPMLDVYEDVATGAYRSAVLDPEGAPRTIVVDAYDEVLPGKRMVTKWHALNSKYRYVAQIQPNVEVSDGDLHPPPARATWTFASGSRLRLEVGEDAMFVDARVNGVLGRFILDTGSSGIAVTREFAARAKLKVLGETKIAGVTETTRSNVLEADSIAFEDGSTLHHPIVFSGFQTFGSGGEVGLMGYDFFAGALVDLDLDAGAITIFDPAANAPSETGALVVLPNLSDGTPVVPAGLNATFGTHALLDTGDAVSVLISDAWTGTLPLLIDPDPEKYFATHRLVLGASGAGRKIECGQLERIVIGPISYDGPPTCMLAGMDRENTIVGYALLKQFNYTFDYPEGKIYMRKRK